MYEDGTEYGRSYVHSVFIRSNTICKGYSHLFDQLHLQFSKYMYLEINIIVVPKIILSLYNAVPLLSYVWTVL